MLPAHICATNLTNGCVRGTPDMSLLGGAKGYSACRDADVSTPSVNMTSLPMAPNEVVYRFMIRSTPTLSPPATTRTT